jgi:hypothetical protein
LPLNPSKPKRTEQPLAVIATSDGPKIQRIT